MSDVVEIRSGEYQAAALAYLREELAQGHSLARVMLERTDFARGGFAALSSVPLSPGQEIEFRRGHHRALESEGVAFTYPDGRTFTSYPVRDAVADLAAFLVRLLAVGSASGLLENAVAEPTDGWLARARSRVLVHGKEVYHPIAPADSREQVAIAIREAHSAYLFLGGVGQDLGAAMATKLGAGPVDRAAITAFADTARCVFSGAYDGEGYLIWQAEGSAAVLEPR